MPSRDRQSLRRPVHPSDGLHICPSCESDLVHPVGWSEAGPERWHVELECPNCLWLGGGEFHQELIDELEEHLDRGTKDLVRDLRRLEKANMEEEIDRFVHALEVDAVLPEDF